MKTLEITNALLVARVSDVQQRKALPAQEKRLRAYAQQMQWKDGKDFEYIEFDETAFGKDRKTFNELVIDRLKASTNKAIVVFDKIDRYSRDSSSSEKQELTRLFQSGQIELHFPSDNLYISKDSPAADLFRLDIGISLAAYYSSSIRDNVKRRFEQLLSDGVWVHRAPLGYKNINIPTEILNKPVKDIIVDEGKAQFVVKAFELRAEGMPYNMIARQLVADGFTNRKAKAELSKGAVEKIINNKFYYGVMTHNGVEYPHKYKPLITRALFNQCQVVKESRKNAKTKWDSNDFTFSDILRCGKCNRAISPFRNRKWVYMRCANPNCDNPNTAESLLLGSMEALLQKITIPNELMEKVITELKSKHDDQQKYYMQSIMNVRREYDEIDVKLESWFDKLVEEQVKPEQYDRIVETLKAKQEDLNNKLDSLTNGNKDFLVTTSYLLDLAGRVEQLFEQGDEAQRSKLLGFVVSNLKLNDKKLSFNVNYPFNMLIEEKERSQNGSETSIWCGYRDSNPGPHPWQGCALTAELHPHTLEIIPVRGIFFNLLTCKSPERVVRAIA